VNPFAASHKSLQYLTRHACQCGPSGSFAVPVYVRLREHGFSVSTISRCLGIWANFGRTSLLTTRSRCRSRHQAFGCQVNYTVNNPRLVSVRLKFTSSCATSKTRSSQELSDLRNSTVDEGRPLNRLAGETQITFRCLRSKGRGGERRRKSPKRNSVRWLPEEDRKEPLLSCRKELRRCRNRGS